MTLLHPSDSSAIRRSTFSKASLYCLQIQTFKDIILQKEEQLTQVNQQHEQELFKLAAKSDASADLEQVTLASPTASLKSHWAVC